MIKRLGKQIGDAFIWIFTQMNQYPCRAVMVLAALGLGGCLLYVRIGLGLVAWADWTGFGEYPLPKSGNHPAKTLWDWLDLVAIPVVLAFGEWIRNRSERKSDRNIALDQQRQVILQAYYDRMAELILEKGLGDALEGSPVLNVARTQTLAALRVLDGERKGQVVQFLCEVGLHRLSLAGADLKLANLMETDLRWADLSGADLRGAKYSVNTQWPESFDPVPAGAVIVDEVAKYNVVSSAYK